MNDFHLRLIIVVVIALTVAARLMYDYLYPMCNPKGRVGWRRQLFLATITLPVSIPIFLQLAGYEILPMNLEVPADAMFRTVGVVLGVIAGVGMTWPRAMSARKSAWSSPMTAPSAIQKHELVTFGPYRYIRHPFYAACLLGVVAIEVTLASYLLFIVPPLAFLYVTFFVLREEVQLVATYGEQYTSYQARSWRLIPLLF